MADSLEKAQTLIDLGRYELAIDQLIRALAEDPENAWVYVNLTRCHLALERTKPALAAASQAFALAPDLDATHYWMAECHLAMGNLAHAERFIAEAVRIDPRSVTSLNLAGWIATMRLNWYEASDFLDRALAIEPTHTDSRNLKTHVLFQTGNRALAKSFNEESLRLDPENGFAQSIFGASLWEQGDPEKAAICFDEALRQDPHFELIRRAKIDLEKIKHPVLGRLLRLRRSKITENDVIHYVFLFFALFGFLWAFNVEKTPLKNNDLGVPLSAVIIFVFLGPWTMDPLTDFFLNAKGRRFLTPEEVRVSKATAALFGASLLGIALMVFLSRDWWMLGGYAYLLPSLFLMPLLGLLRGGDRTKKHRKTLIILMSMMFLALLAGGVLVIGSLLIPNASSAIESDMIAPIANRSESMKIVGFWCWNFIPLFALPCAYLVKK